MSAVGPVSALRILLCATSIGGVAPVEAHADASACRVFQDQNVFFLGPPRGPACPAIIVHRATIHGATSVSESIHGSRRLFEPECKSPRQMQLADALSAAH